MHHALCSALNTLSTLMFKQPRMENHHEICCAEEETKAQRGQVTCLRSHRLIAPWSKELDSGLSATELSLKPLAALSHWPSDDISQ